MPQTWSDKFCELLISVEKLIVKAKKGKKSLKGENPYAERFHKDQIAIKRQFNEAKTKLEVTATPNLRQTITDIDNELGYFFQPKTSPKDRRDLRRHIEELLKTEIEPALQAIRTLEAEFIPEEILAGSKGNIQKIAQQACVCFSAEAYDACAVMLRKLLEVLVVEAFEAKGIADRIMEVDGNYSRFSKMISILVSTKETPMGRTSKQHLPQLAEIFNNCAHNSGFFMSRSHLQLLQSQVILAVQELVALSNP